MSANYRHESSDATDASAPLDSAHAKTPLQFRNTEEPEKPHEMLGNFLLMSVSCQYKLHCISVFFSLMKVLHCFIKEVEIKDGSFFCLSVVENVSSFLLVVSDLTLLYAAPLPCFLSII